MSFGLFFVFPESVLFEQETRQSDKEEIYIEINKHEWKPAIHHYNIDIVYTLVLSLFFVSALNDIEFRWM